MSATAKTKAFDVHVRVTSTGTAYALTTDDIEDGTSFSDIADHEDWDAPYIAFRIAVTAPLPSEVVPVVADVTVPVDTPPVVAAELAS